MLKRSSIAASAAIALLALDANAASAELKVVVTSKPIHALVAGVMTGAGTPRLLIEGNASPHTYAMKPSDAKALNGADVVFRVSEALEPFTAKVFASLPKSVRKVSLTDAPGLALLERREGGPFEAHVHEKGKGHKHGHGKAGKDEDETDPHVWLDPRNAKRMVDHIAATLAEASPAEAATFKANAAKMAGDLDALDAEIAQELKGVEKLPVVVFHDSLQYLEARYGITAVGSIMVSPDQQPSAKRLTDLRKKIGSLQAACVLAEPQFPGKLVASVIEGSKAKTAIVDPEGGLIDPGPGLYATLMRRLAAALKGCAAAS